jgi:transposase
MGWDTACVPCRKVAPKKIPETDAILAQLAQVNAQADADETVLRLSLDAKATVWVGAYSRRGQTRVIVKAADHDFQPSAQLTPFGIFLPHYGDLYLYFTASRLTSDFRVDGLTDGWISLRDRFPQVKTLVLNLDNGPENHSRRTQFMQRITDRVETFAVTVALAYYPPYHSQYNPIERVWGVLEKHWNGSRLDTCDTVLQFAQTMTFRGLHPLVQLVRQTYHRGVRLTHKQMAALEQRFERLKGLSKWFVRIAPIPG